jgi:hypothetical protein
LFAGRARLPTCSVETSSLDFQLAILASSDRITLMTAREAQQKIETGLLTRISHDRIAPRSCDGIGTRQDWCPTTAQTHFIECLRKHAKRVGTPPPLSQRPPRNAALGRIQGK